MCCNKFVWCKAVNADGVANLEVEHTIVFTIFPYQNHGANSDSASVGSITMLFYFCTFRCSDPIVFAKEQLVNLSGGNINYWEIDATSEPLKPRVD